MSRSILTTFFAIFLIMAMADQALGLAGVLNRVRNNSIWGKSRTAETNRYSKSLTPVQVATAEQSSAEHSPSHLPPQSVAFFDAESLRQEMTDLVYQRNMERMTSS